MIIDESMQLEAEERAEKLLAYRTNDDKWAVLEDRITAQVARQREEAIEYMVTERIRDLLYPGVSREQWQKLRWSSVLAGSTPVGQFLHKLRLALAAGSTSGRL